MAYSAPATIAGHIMHMAGKNLAIENCDAHSSRFQMIRYAHDVHHLLYDLSSTTKLHDVAAMHKIHTTVSYKHYDCAVNYDDESYGRERCDVAVGVGYPLSILQTNWRGKQRPTRGLHHLRHN